ncbi:transporter substrate-binding domain-containing protein [Microbacterium sp. Marseille-Q6965]|uniref:transporter substrate-binding domain-containing protein n=1 Tax=Microbacterium sp. Marseille-Q6965 TaxID=2965072 RepID=UPI0021B6FEC0|nr:transporter substrate-binding domain-containing protein [Microbacterium sp. Marseille-Q6965]
MKLSTTLGLVAIAGVSLALASCGSAGAPDQGAGDAPADEAVNTDAPAYDLLPEAIKDKGVITIAGDTHPPYRTIEENGDITGIDPDIQAALSEQLGVPFEISTSSGLDAMLTGMLSGRYDAFNGPVRTTPEREADFDTVVWMTTRTSYLYLAERSDELSEPEDLCGARVAGVTGSVTESQLERYSEWCAAEGLEAPEFIGLEDTNSTFLALNSDRADYAGTTQTAAKDVQVAEPDRYEYLVQGDEQGAGIDLLAMFMPKSNELAPAMFAAFEGIFDNGEYERIMTEWELTDVMVEEPQLNPMTAG